ncbi:BTAD domain-containing putative transcriptional regulator, partial [Kitasatospora putterlickiae]|uniref:BTAD domain-containing putative transcriptional regulator n=1 Tax=Kitasatospora putterlickiae TaxID=221725 RepID=UPI0031D35492
AAGQPPAAAAELREALALWRGPVLDGLPGRSIAAGAVPLDELRLTAWEDCLDLEAALGRHRESVPELTTLVADHPLRERFVGQLMRALHASGRTADALTAHRRFTTLLAEELGLDPSPELRRLHLELLTTEAAGREEAPRPVRGGGPPGGPERSGAGHGGRDRGAPPRPAQLPPPTATFTGRDAELAALDAFADAATTAPADPPADPATNQARDQAGAPAARICAVSGSAGIGKTTLVVQWAHRRRAHFPGGQLYADLHGFSAEPPLPPHAVLARFLRALGVPGEQVPSVPEEAAALYRSLLAGQRVLVVLDNARSAEQVRPLLPGAPECLTVVTSRSGLAGLTARDGARPLALDLMPARDAVALLDRVIGG